MLNKFWTFSIIISIIYAIVFGNLNNLNNEIFESSTEAITLTISLIGTMALWNGIIKIVEKTSLINKLSKLLKPIINVLFPELKKNEKAKNEISMNMIANILGLGNAATPLGIKAMQTMNQNNKKKDTITNSMAMFIVLNTASIQIIPTTVIAIRNSLGSDNPTSIIIPTWIATICAAIVGVFVTKLFIYLTGK